MLDVSESILPNTDVVIDCSEVKAEVYFMILLWSTLP
jgi:hypothetical protein